MFKVKGRKEKRNSDETCVKKMLNTKTEKEKQEHGAK